MQRTERPRKARVGETVRGLVCDPGPVLGWGCGRPGRGKATGMPTLPCPASALHHPLAHREGAPLTVPQPRAGGSRCRLGLSGGRGLGAPSAEPAARRRSGTPRPGWRARAGRRGVWPRGCGAAWATHVLRVPLVHRGQWRPGRHLVRATGSGRGPSGRAACGLRGRRQRAQARAEAGRSAPAGRGRCNQRPGAEPGRGRAGRGEEGALPAAAPGTRAPGREGSGRAGAAPRAEAPGAASGPR